MDRREQDWRRVLARWLGRVGLAGAAFGVYERLQARGAGPLPALGADGLPLPPALLQIRMAGSASVGVEQDGSDAAASIRTLLAHAHVELELLETVLDFGVGCGRIARHWGAVRGPGFYACDIDAAARSRGAGAISRFVNTAVNQLEPPLPYVTETFDLVYAYSVHGLLALR